MPDTDLDKESKRKRSDCSRSRKSREQLPEVHKSTESHVNPSSLTSSAKRCGGKNWARLGRLLVLIWRIQNVRPKGWLRTFWIRHYLRKLRRGTAVGRSVGWAGAQVVVQLRGRAVAQSCGRAVQSSGRSVGRPVGPSVGLLVSRSVGRSIGRSVSRSSARPVGRLVGRLGLRWVGWLGRQVSSWAGWAGLGGASFFQIFQAGLAGRGLGSTLS